MKLTGHARLQNTKNLSLNTEHIKVASNLESKIIQAIDCKWLTGLHSNLTGFTNCTPVKPSTHLQTYGATLNDIDIQESIDALDSVWNPTENPITKFECDYKIEQWLKKFSIPPNPLHYLDLIKAAVKCSGTFNAAICKWGSKQKADRTFTKFALLLLRSFPKQLLTDKQCNQLVTAFLTKLRLQPLLLITHTINLVFAILPN